MPHPVPLFPEGEAEEVGRSTSDLAASAGLGFHAATLMNPPPPIPPPPTDGEWLRAYRKTPGGEDLRLLLQQYRPFVRAMVGRRTEDPAAAEEVIRAVFLTLARRARRLSPRTVLADWLFQVTELALRKRLGRRKPGLRRRFFGRPPQTMLDDVAIWDGIRHDLDPALAKLSRKPREAILLGLLLNADPSWVARTLRRQPAKILSSQKQGLKQLSRFFGKRGVAVDGESLARLLSIEGCAGDPGAELEAALLPDMIEAARRRPTLKLARRTLATLAWRRWRRRVAIGVPTILLLLALAGFAIWKIDERTGHSRLLTTFLIWTVKHQGRSTPGLREPARTWPTNEAPPLDATVVDTPREFYRATNIWRAHLSFTREAWEALEPRRIGPLPHFFRPDGTVLLRNPEARRSGLAGVLGFDFDWSRADLEIGGRVFTNVGVRVKGNGTYLSSLATGKRSLKVDVNKFTSGRRWQGLEELNFHNVLEDRSYLSDALAYEFFRATGVPAPRTAFGWLTVSVAGQGPARPLGLFALIEPVDEPFLAERFGSRKTPLFKPVTYRLFEDLGRDWTNYAAIYDLKTKATPAQRQRVVDLAQLVSHASDDDFAARLPEFLDLDEFARFLAGHVMLSCYDSLLANGQNYYLYLDPRSNRFGFIPWDMDLAWGAFFLLGTTEQRERASIWHPWVGENRFLERVLGVESFRALYRARLEEMLAGPFQLEQLAPRIDELARQIRGPVAAESDFRFEKFQVAVGTNPPPPIQGKAEGPNRPVTQLKRFIAKRAASVRQQLDGKSEGVVMRRGGSK